jgi:hypothetical protein
MISLDVATIPHTMTFVFFFFFFPGCHITFPPPPSQLSNSLIGRYFDELFSASGGVLPYNYSVINGSLPSGTSLDDSTGEVIGILQSEMTGDFEIQATDSVGCTGVASYSFIGVIQKAILSFY